MRPSPYLVVTLALMVGSCANAPIRVWEMDSTELQNVPSESLCYAIAQGMASRRSTPLAELERQRRSLSCEAEIAERVSDCSKLVIANPDPHASMRMAADGRGYQHVAYLQIRNTDTAPRSFRIVWRGSLTLLQHIGANSEQSFEVSAYLDSPVDSNGQLRRTRAYLQECLVEPGYGRREVSW